MKIGRVACYGYVERGAGSVASANHLLLRELTRRGIGVDLFAARGHVPPPEGLPEQSFRYRPFSQPPLDRVIDSMPGGPSWVARRLCLPALTASWRRTYQPAAEASHAKAPYDALLALGTTAPFELKGVPTITWLQGPLTTELEAIRRLRAQIVEARGWPFYLALVAGYRYSEPILRGQLSSSEQIVVGSEWSRRAVIGEGFDAARVHSVPYPIDLHLFSPAKEGSTVAGSNCSLVSLGRLDPRKRLDLLLEAFRLVLLEEPDSQLQIVGRPGYTPKQLSLIERFPDGERVRYQSQIAHRQVPSLLKESAALVQASENENFGSSVAEALACGIPVVVGPSNGTAQYVDECSQRFEGYTPGAVAAAIVNAIRIRRDDPEAVRRSARDAAERWFDPVGVTDRLLEIMESAQRPANSR